MTDLFGPGSLDEVWIEDLVPAVLTLNVCAVLKVAGHCLPVVQTLCFHYLPQFLVLNHSSYVTHNSLQMHLDVGTKYPLDMKRSIMVRTQS